MKENTKKILVWLKRETEGQLAWVKREEVLELIANFGLSQAGGRSLLHLLNKEGLIEERKIGTEMRWRLTEWGRTRIEAEYFVLSRFWQQWNGRWEMIVLGEAPSFDKEFRSLRKVLKESGLIMLTRGVYLAPEKMRLFTEKGVGGGWQTTFGKYAGNMWIVAFDQLTHGNLEKTVFAKKHLEDVLTLYSGISNEIDHLLDKNSKKKAAIGSTKHQLYDIFDRLYTIGKEDWGFSCLFSGQSQLSLGNYVGFEDNLRRLQNCKLR